MNRHTRVVLLFILLLTTACTPARKEVVLHGCPATEYGQDVKLSQLKIGDGSESLDRVAKSGADAIQLLKNGNKRYREGQSIHAFQDQRRRDETTKSQSPHTIILSCSDSRVPPEVVFDQGIGEVFVIRTAGEVADAAAVASIEYAVEHLGAKALLVMGHMSCGAVKATLETPTGKSAGSKDLDKLVNAIRPHVKSFTVESAGAGLINAVEAQVNGVLHDLETRSKIIAGAIHHHHIEVARGVYNLESGEVRFW